MNRYEGDHHETLCHSQKFYSGFRFAVGNYPVNATERPFASNGNGVAAFITDGAGNVVGANLTLGGNGTHLGLFTGTGTIQFLPDANDPNIVHVPGEITYVASNAIVFR